MSQTHFGERLAELRVHAGLTQQQLADCAGLKIGGIRDLEQGINRLPRWDTVLALAEALGVDCRAFQEQPAARPRPSRGRPRKPEASGSAKPKRPHGRPKKGK